jgi:hypothetical protein
VIVIGAAVAAYGANSRRRKGAQSETGGRIELPHPPRRG